MGNFKAFLFGIIVWLFRLWFSFEDADSFVSDFGIGKVSFLACIDSEVDVRDDKVKYILSNVLLNADRYPVYNYGDLIEVSGFAEVPGMIEDFDYRKYLLTKNVYVIINNPVIKKVDGSCGSFFMKKIYDIKNFFSDRLYENFTEPYSSFVAGLILGLRKGIPDEVMADFDELGLTHIVAISGYNVTLVIVAVFSVLSFLKRKVRILFAIVFVVLFTLLVGAGSSVVRASCMGIVGLVAVYFGRSKSAFRILIITAFLMSFWNPFLPIYDSGFQLSFLSTAGLIIASPFMTRVFKRFPSIFFIKENLQTTFAAQAFTLPLIIKLFGRFSILCPIANIAVLPFVPVIMILGFLSFFWKGFAFLCYAVLKVFFFTVGILADFSRIL